MVKVMDRKRVLEVVAEVFARVLDNPNGRPAVVRAEVEGKVYRFDMRKLSAEELTVEELFAEELAAS